MHEEPKFYWYPAYRSREGRVTLRLDKRNILGSKFTKNPKYRTQYQTQQSSNHSDDSTVLGKVRQFTKSINFLDPEHLNPM